MTRSGILESVGSTPGALSEQYQVQDFSSLRWAWVGRHLSQQSPGSQYQVLRDYSKPQPADVAVVRVEKVGYHHHIETEQERRLRLYAGDRLIGVFGNRYATDVFEGRVLELNNLHLLTASGLIGTVVSRHRDVGRPTTVSFLGYLAEASGARINQRINLKDLRFQPSTVVPSFPEMVLPDVVLIVGTGMNTGKTTVTRKVLQALAARGVKVAGCKLTGSASPRDLYEMRATGAVLATDFSDYGFPSTYGASLDELIRLLDVMRDACGRAGAEVAVVEIADGFLQPETQMLLESDEIRHRVRGVVAAGACSSSLLFATQFLQKAGHDVWAASGLATNSPLFVREFSDRSSIPVASSRGGGAQLARIVMDNLIPAAVGAQVASQAK